MKRSRLTNADRQGASKAAGPKLPTQRAGNKMLAAKQAAGKKPAQKEKLTAVAARLKPLSTGLTEALDARMPALHGAARSLPLLAGVMLFAGLLTYLYASRVAARAYRLETVSVTTYGGGDDDGNDRTYRILHLSDLHMSYPETDKLKFLEEVTGQEFDFIVITGDVFENFSGIQYAKSLLSLKPKLGAYVVLGNHDYYNYSYWNKIVGRINRSWRHPMKYRDVTPMVEALEQVGYTVLRNETRTHVEGVHVVGIDYPGIRTERLHDITAQAPKGYLILNLFHMPRLLGEIARSGAHLALGGHTHGGQIRVPGIGALITDSELKRHEASGLVHRGDTIFHISRGLSADPKSNFRLFCPPAATVIEVTHKSGAKPAERQKQHLSKQASA
jgi:predicted MPP superfamily phosphohydrolase